MKAQRSIEGIPGKSGRPEVSQSDLALYEQLALRRLRRAKDEGGAPVRRDWLRGLGRLLVAVASAFRSVRIEQEVAPGREPLRRSEWERASEARARFL